MPKGNQILVKYRFQVASVSDIISGGSIGTGKIQVLRLFQVCGSFYMNLEILRVDVIFWGIK